MAVSLLEITLADKVTPQGLKIAGVFKDLRGAAGITQEEAARRAHMSLSGYRNYEQGKRQLRIEQLPTFSRTFGVPVTFLAARLDLAVPDVDVNLRGELAKLMPDAEAADLDELMHELMTLPPDDRKQVVDGFRYDVRGRKAHLGRA